MKLIYTNTAQDALTLWNISGNYLSVLALGDSTLAVRQWHTERFMQNFSDAAKALGFALVPITQPEPDSGRPSIPETEPSVGEQF